MTMHKMSSVAAAVGLAGLAVLGTAASASAAPSPESCAYGMTCQVSVSDSTVVRGQSVTASTGAGAFAPGSTVTVKVLGSTYTVTAASDGSASITFTVPDHAKPGTRHAVFTGGGATVRVAFEIVAGSVEAVVVAEDEAVTGGSALPFTGSDDVVALSVAGLTLVGAGAGFVVVARRRGSKAATAA